MKKILLLICVILNGCCYDCGVITENDPFEGFIHEMSDKSIVSEATSYHSDWYANNSIAFSTLYELPETRTKDFLGTLIMFLTKPELNDDIDIRFGYDNYNYVSLEKRFNDSNQVTVDNNSSYDLLEIDPKEINYYQVTLTFYVEWLGITNKAQIHLRQDLDPTTKISYMIMIQPFKDRPYEYIGHTVLIDFDIRSTYGTEKPLPDVFK